MFHEQPQNVPRWLPLGLEIEVENGQLRYRVRRNGHWHEHNLHDLISAEVVSTGQWSWPVSLNAGPFGARVVSTSGRGVLLKFRNGKQLLLGSGQPEKLLRAIRNG